MEKIRLKEQSAKNNSWENGWEDIRRYGGKRKYPYPDISEELDEISGAIASLGGLKVNYVTFDRSGIILTFYVFPRGVGLEFTIQDSFSDKIYCSKETLSYRYFRSMVVGRNRQEVTSVQESLEKILKKRKCELFTTYTGKQEEEKNRLATYGFTQEAHVTGIKPYSVS